MRRLRMHLVGLVILIRVLLFSDQACQQQQTDVHQDGVTGKVINGTLPVVPVVQLPPSKGENNDNNDDDNNGNIWSMVGSMRGNEEMSPIEHTSHSGDSSSATATTGFEWHMRLDHDDRYRLDWRTEYGANRIIFALSINQERSHFRRGSDIFALGFSEDGELASSDFCIVWYDLSHRLHLQDARTDSRNRLELIDSSQSVCKHLHTATPGHYQVSPSAGHRRRRPRSLVDDLNNDVVDDDGEDAANNDDEPTSQSLSLGRRAGGRSHEVTGGHPKTRRLGGTGHSTFGAQEAEAAQDSAVLRIIFERPLDVCDDGGSDSNTPSSPSHYSIDNGTTHLVWFTLKGPLLSIDGLNLTELATRDHQPGKGEGAASATNTGTGGDLPRFESGMKRVQLIASTGGGSNSAGSSAANSRRSTAAAAANGSSNHGSSGSIDMKMEGFKVPAKETTYWCKLFKLPRRFESRRYHITRYEAVIEKGNDHIVHHMELFNCANLNPDQERDLRQLHEAGGWQGDCGGPSRPPATEPCRRVIMAWAIGARPLEYPEQVGQSIGGHNYSPYVLLEVHYNNVRSSAGLVDNSGLRFHYTSHLRPFDAGILEVGLEYTDKNSIPPNMITPLAGHCVAECTRAALTSSLTGSELLELGVGDGDGMRRGGGAPRKGGTQEEQHLEDGIYIFAGQMHTHLTGVASWTEHVREGRLLGELQRDNHYSPHFQEIRLLPEPVHLAPGDALIHYCLYDTRRRANITLGGFATSDEMCVTYLHYYPRTDLEVCKSSVETSALEAYFAYLAREEAQNTSERLLMEPAGPSGQQASSNDDDDKVAAGGQQVKGKSVSENYRSIDWRSARRRRELMEFYAEAPLSVQCNRSNGARFPGFWNGIAPTRLWPSPGDEQHSPLNMKERYSSSSPSNGQQLIGYRGREYGRRHAQCRVTGVNEMTMATTIPTSNINEQDLSHSART